MPPSAHKWVPPWFQAHFFLSVLGVRKDASNGTAQPSSYRKALQPASASSVHVLHWLYACNWHRCSQDNAIHRVLIALLKHCSELAVTEEPAGGCGANMSPT